MGNGFHLLAYQIDWGFKFRGGWYYTNRFVFCGRRFEPIKSRGGLANH
jgi:hypothetical protein